METVYLLHGLGYIDGNFLSNKLYLLKKVLLMTDELIDELDRANRRVGTVQGSMDK